MKLLNEREALMTLTDLREALRRKGIIDVPRSTIRNWYLFGVETPGGNIKLTTKKLGRRRVSSVAWVEDFLSETVSPV